MHLQFWPLQWVQKRFFFVFDKKDNILCKRPKSIFRLYENNKGWHPLKFVATPLILHHKNKNMINEYNNVSDLEYQFICFN